MGHADDISNWTGNQRCTPSSIVEPHSVDELAELVSNATDRSQRVKAVGAGHSFTSAAMTSGVLARLTNLGSLESVDQDGVAIAGAGISLSELSSQLRSRGRSLSNLGDISVQTLAGAAATATHGTGRTFGNISSQIDGFELVTADGGVLWCDGSHNADIFRAGRVAVGALGIITRIAIRTEPAFNLRLIEDKVPMTYLLGDWKGFVASAEHPEFFWIPGTDSCLTKQSDRTTDEGSTFGRVKTTMEKLLVENAAFAAAMHTVKRFPGSRQRVVDLMVNLATRSERVDYSERIFASPRHVRFIEMEYGIPIEAVPEAVKRVQRLVATLDDPPSFPVEVRVSEADDIDISTGEGRRSGWIAVHRLRGSNYEPYFRGVATIMGDYAGRPHWGKLHYQTAETLQPLYSRWQAFLEIRDRVDPTRTFANDYTQRIFGA